MHDIQWYPGHMTKSRRMIASNLKYIDVVIEIVDARAPFASRNPDFDDLFAQKQRIILLNKGDIADPIVTKEWMNYYQEQGWLALTITATKRNWWPQLEKLIAQATAEKQEAAKQKGIKKTVRLLVAGIPNVGKSTFINSIAKTAHATVGNRPGVTKGKQWIRVSDYLELMDTPGMLWPKLEDQTSAFYLACLGSIRDEILDVESLAMKLLERLAVLYPQNVQERYKKWSPDLPTAEAMLEAVCKSRGFLLSGGIYDMERGANTVLDEFRAGKLGRITLEKLSDHEEEKDELSV